MEPLTRPIHPISGNCSIAKAERLATLYGYGTANGLPWRATFAAHTRIQGNDLWIPNTVAPPVLVHGGVHPVGIGTDEGVDHNQSSESDEISLETELGKAMQDGSVLTKDTPLTVKMKITPGDPRTPLRTPGAKEFHEVNGDVLSSFDANRALHGAEYALRLLFAGPCAAFALSLEATLLKLLKDKLIPPAEMEAKLEALPGVIG
jgi:hypothetical protein